MPRFPLQSRLPRAWCLAIVAIVACDEVDPLAPGTSPHATSRVAAAAATTARPRPVRGTSESVPVLDFSPPAGRCPASHPVLVTIEETLQLSHLGRTSVVQSHCIAVPGPESRPDFGAGTSTFTAANGDMVFATYGGTITPVVPPAGPPTEGVLRVQMTIVGGTGRFAGATGALTGTGIQVFNEVATVSYEGWIAY